MQLGIFAKTFEPSPFPEALKRIKGAGMETLHFNFSCIGLESMPGQVTAEVADRIASQLGEQPLTMAGVSGTFNLIDPDKKQREDGLARLGVLSASCKNLGTSVISLCTGTRDPDHMWRAHPDNDTPEAWRDLVSGMSQALSLTEATGVVLGVEPETGNVMNSAVKARQLLDEMASPRLKIIMDPVNLLQPGTEMEPQAMKDEFSRAFDLLGADMVMGHAKERTRDGRAGGLAPGTGTLEWAHYFDLLREHRFDGPVIMHGLPAETVSEGARFLRTFIDQH